MSERVEPRIRLTRATAPAQLDHLVVAAVTLADGIAYIADATGAAPRPGGKHAAMGTHNALLRLGERTYLEIIAIDPDAPAPPRRRWFDLDDIALQSELTEQPRLIHWVARVDDIEARGRRLPGSARSGPSDGAGRLPVADHDPGRRQPPRQGHRADADPVGRARCIPRTAAAVEGVAR